MLAAHHLVKRYYGAAVVDDVTFELSAGEVTGYLGPNGSGKTTTVRMLTGLIEPTSGSVTFRGTPIGDNIVEFRRHVGYVPEEPYLYPFLSGREYLELVGRLRELPETLLCDKIPAMLAALGIGDAAGQSISSYSKGMKQKVLLCAALLHDPDLVIFDEPESGLDVSTVLVLRHLVQALASRGKAILYSSHILESVEKVCDKVIVLHRGRVAADASVQHLRTVMARRSLEEVFSELVLQEDPGRTAIDLVNLVASHY
jgi:ABC-2 type transport system ATP-binding protein